MQKITVVINPKTGEATYEVEGVMGAKCTDITNILTQSNEVKELQYTHELEDPEVLPDYITNPTEE